MPVWVAWLWAWVCGCAYMAVAETGVHAFSWRVAGLGVLAARVAPAAVPVQARRVGLAGWASGVSSRRVGTAACRPLARFPHSLSALWPACFVALLPAYCCRSPPLSPATTSLTVPPPQLVVSERTAALVQTKAPSAMAGLFKAEQRPAEKHSKIWLALNPQPLAFQTARERAEAEDAKVPESRGTFGERPGFVPESQSLAPLVGASRLAWQVDLGVLGTRQYGLARDIGKAPEAVMADNEDEEDDDDENDDAAGGLTGGAAGFGAPPPPPPESESDDEPEWKEGDDLVRRLCHSPCCLSWPGEWLGWGGGGH